MTLVKKGEKNIKDVQLWGNELQVKANWKKGDWNSIADRVFRSAHNPHVIKGLVEAKKGQPKPENNPWPQQHQAFLQKE